MVCEIRGERHWGKNLGSRTLTTAENEAWDGQADQRPEFLISLTIRISQEAK